MAQTFVRGFDSMPTIEEISQIEGIFLVDNLPSGGLGAAPSGFGCLVGEFADMSRSFEVDQSGQVVANYRPDFVLSQADLVTKFGGFDSTLGQFGAAMGNGYAAVAGKTFGNARLLCLPVLLASQYAGRMWRQLPTCKSATDPTPIVPLVAVAVPAGYEFKTGSSRVRTAVAKTFTADQYFSSGVDGAVTAAGMAAATQTFTSATADFTGATTPSRAVYKGDMLVLGVIGGLGGLGANADTYRVVSVTSATAIVVQKLDGSNFNWTTGSSLPFRIHPGAAGDTDGRVGTSTIEGFALAEAGGYKVAARPTSATISSATTVNPTVAPPTSTATNWDALSGLKFRTHPTQPLTYTAALQAPNAANSATMDAAYQSALEGLLGSEYPAKDIGGIACARKSQTIALATRQHVLTSFSEGNPRVAFISPAVNVNSPSSVIALAYPGVEPLRSRHVEYLWPPVLTLPLVPAVGTAIATADGNTTVDGRLDMPMDEFRLALFTRLPPEESPGEAIEPVPSTFAAIVGYARGIAAPNLSTFALLKSRGVETVKVDTPPAQIQSAVNTLLPTAAIDPKTFANRQPFSNFISRALATIAGPYKSVIATQQQQDSLSGQCIGFLESLGVPGSGFTPERIKGYLFNKVSTPQEEDVGVFKWAVTVKMLSTMDYIGFILSVGTTVDVTPQEN